MSFSSEECVAYNRFSELNKNGRGVSEFPVKANVEAKIGERSVDKLIDAVVDAFSPATETLGALGDAVRLARVGMAARITTRAKEIADEHGFTLTAPPLKFLVPFYEKASLEEEDSELHEMWSELLVSTSIEFHSENIIFADILSRLSKREADILLSLSKRGGGADAISFGDEVVGKKISDFRKELTKNAKYDEIKELKEQIEIWLSDQKNFVIPFDLLEIKLDVEADVGGMEFFVKTKQYEAAGAAYEILEREGLIEIVHHAVATWGGANAKQFSWARLSNLGLRFAVAVRVSHDAAS